MIVENQYLEDIREIWKENNSGYITEESNQMLLNNDKILKIVFLEKNIPARIYCCILEGFPNKIKNIPEKVLYIWEVVTKKDFMGKGIAKKLLNYVLEKFKDYTIYSCIDANNIPSIRLHEKNGFKELYRFLQMENGKTTQHIIFVREAVRDI